MRVPAIISAICLLGASCGGLSDAAAPSTSASETATPAVQSTAAPTTTVPEQLALDDGDEPARVMIDTGPTTTTSTIAAAPAATRPSSAGPVVTGAPPTTVDPATLYVGVLGGLGYDAIALGNHDFDFGPDLLADFLAAYPRQQLPPCLLYTSPSPRDA